jgi:hypothetical protein
MYDYHLMLLPNLPLSISRPSCEVIPIIWGTLWNLPWINRSVGDSLRKISSPSILPRSITGVNKHLPRYFTYCTNSNNIDRTTFLFNKQTNKLYNYELQAYFHIRERYVAEGIANKALESDKYDQCPLFLFIISRPLALPTLLFILGGTVGRKVQESAKVRETLPVQQQPLNDIVHVG